MEVNCKARGPRSADVVVSYDMQSLGASGEAYLAKMTDADFAAMIGEWPGMIEKAATRL